MTKGISESEMAAPVLRLFPKRKFRRFAEVPLGKKKVDLVCEPRTGDADAVCVELKLSDWRTALWQASRNFHLGHKSYVALWHESAKRVDEHMSLFAHYGVGLILVGPSRAHIVLESSDRVVRMSRASKRDLYRYLLEV